MSARQAFSAVARGRRDGGLAISLPFDPADVWGQRDRYDVTGTIGVHTVRGRIRSRDGEHLLELGPAWCRDNATASGAAVAVVLEPEGPQVAALAEDITSALSGEVEARRFFEELPTFYRKNFIRWIEAARRPETRAKRIAETVAVLKAGKRER